MTVDNTTKAAALKLLRRGLATYVEIAELSGLHRQTIRYWAQELGAENARPEYLKKQWERATRKALPPRL